MNAGTALQNWPVKHFDLCPNSPPTMCFYPFPLPKLSSFVVQLFAVICSWKHTDHPFWGVRKSASQANRFPTIAQMTEVDNDQVFNALVNYVCDGCHTPLLFDPFKTSEHCKVHFGITPCVFVARWMATD
jgi:hypothetical protein